MKKQNRNNKTAAKAGLSHFQNYFKTLLLVLNNIKKVIYFSISIYFKLMLLVINTIKVIVNEVFSQAFGFIAGIFYMVWRMIFPKRKYDGSNISREFRRVFESKRLQHRIGINIIIVIMLGLALRFPLYAVGGYYDNSIETFIEQIEVSADPVLETASTFQDPVAGYISQNFTWHHSGVDIAGNENNSVRPIASGKVVMIEKAKFGYGKQVLIAHGSGLYSRYAHLNMIKVEINQVVNHDTLIGYVGSTGFSTGPHLHLEVYKDGVAVNPLTYIPNHYMTQYININQEPTTEIALAIEKDSQILGAAYIASESSKTATMASELVVKEVGAGFEDTLGLNGMIPGSLTQTAEASSDASLK